MEAFHDTERFYDQMDKFTANYSSLTNKLVTIIGDNTHGPIVKKKQVVRWWIRNSKKTSLNFPTSNTGRLKDYYIAGLFIWERNNSKCIY